MSPYKFRYYRTPSPVYDYTYRDGDYDYRRRRRDRDYDYRDYKRKRDYDYDDEESIYGETVYEYDTDYPPRGYVPPPPPRRRDRKEYNWYRYYNRPHRHHHHHHHHRRRRSDDYDHHVPHIHYISARSEPTLRYTPNYPQRMEVTMLKSLPDPPSDPRVTVVDKRNKTTQIVHNRHCNCHACPEKSSRAIPTMHYDELRCPHCAAHVQPAQEEILAYPWTVQSYRPARKARSLPGQQISINDNPGGPYSTVSGAPPTVLTYKPPNRRRRPNDNTDNKENLSTIVHNAPIFNQTNSGPSRSQPMIAVDATKRGQGRDSIVARTQQRPPVKSMVNSNTVVDDIKPYDSASNVVLPPLRAQSNELIRTDYRPRNKARAETEVDANYTREKFFRDLDQQQPPRLAATTPRPQPAKDTSSNISRMLKGQYYDRLNGRTYTYNVNYEPRKVYSDRHPQR